MAVWLQIPVVFWPDIPRCPRHGQAMELRRPGQTYFPRCVCGNCKPEPMDVYGCPEFGCPFAGVQLTGSDKMVAKAESILRGDS